VINRHLHTVDALSIVAMQKPFAADQQSFAVHQNLFAVDQQLTGFDHCATTIDQRSTVGCVVIPVQDKSCPYRDPAGARSLYDNILVRLRPTPDTLTR